MKKSKLKNMAAVADAPLQTQPLPVGENMPVAYALIRPDPNQPRKTFSEESLAELAQSIGQQGILQPLILERVPAKFKIQEPDLTSDDYQLNTWSAAQWKTLDRCDAKNYETLRATWAGNFGGLGTEADYVDGFVIVCGERRWRAAGIVGLKDVPAIVYTNLTSEQRFAMQFVENNQRENVTALEEAEAMTRQLAERKATDPTFSAEKLALELGISRASCYALLKLPKLSGPVRAALLEGKISTSVAGEIAKLATPKMQENLLGTIEHHLKFGHAYSVREVQDLVDDEIKQLSEAPFDPKKEYVREGDHSWLPCSGCPHRTGNMLAEFPELASRPNVCTNTDCWGEKCKAHYLITAEAKRAEGTKVFTAKEFKKVGKGYVSGEQHIWGTNKDGELKKLMGKHKPEPVLVVSETGIKEYYAEDEAQMALKEAGVKMRKDEAPKAAETEAQKAKREEEAKQAQARSDRAKSYIESQIPALAKALPKLKAGPAFEIAALLMDGFKDSYHDLNVDVTPLRKMTGAQAEVLAEFFIASANDPWDFHEWQDAPCNAWKIAGIDLKAGFAKADKEALLALAKAAPKQNTLLDVPATPGKTTKKKKGAK